MSLQRPHTKHQQLRFLRAFLSLDQPIADIIRRQRIDPRLFIRWLHQATFRRRLRAVRRYLHRTRELHIELAALHASTKLLQHCRSDDLADTIKPLVELVRLARRPERRRPSTSRELSSEPASPLYHPNVPADEAEQLIRELGPDPTA